MAVSGQAEIAVVTQPVANLHRRAEAQSDVVSQATYSTNVEVLQRKGKWRRVRMPDRYEGWITATSIRVRAPYAITNAVMVDNLFASVYRETDITKHAPVLTLPYGSALELVREIDARWLEVRLVDGQTAFVQQGDIRRPPDTLAIPQMLALAQRFLGLPYLWGGVSSFGFDCSGFTQLLCWRRGIHLPRDAQPQADWEGVRPVSKEELEPGDLLFFGPNDKKINHTGLYLGQGRFIHATAYLKPIVQISELADPHWTQLLVACRRPK